MRLIPHPLIHSLIRRTAANLATLLATSLARHSMTAPVGSKANPSKYDPLSKLADDEPYFVIRADDVLSSALVELHAYIGAGQAGAAHNKLAEIMALTSQKPPRPSDSPKYRETFAISAAMEKWRNSQ
jgi:hypothetical protein